MRGPAATSSLLPTTQPWLPDDVHLQRDKCLGNLQPAVGSRRPLQLYGINRYDDLQHRAPPRLP